MICSTIFFLWFGTVSPHPYLFTYFYHALFQFQTSVIFSVCDITGATQDSNLDNACNCPVDTYLDETGTSECKNCPAGTSTNSARGASSCGKCAKGVMQ